MQDQDDLIMRIVFDKNYISPKLGDFGPFCVFTWLPNRCNHPNLGLISPENKGFFVIERSNFLEVTKCNANENS